MSSQLSAHAITAHTAMTRISVSRCSTLPAHRGSASAEKCSTSFSTDIATLPSLTKGEPAQPVSPSEPARPFHALPLAGVASLRAWRLGDLVDKAGQAGSGWLCAELRRRAAIDRLLVHGPVRHEHGLDAGGEIKRYGFDGRL